MAMTVDHLTVDYYYKKGYHESDRFYRRLSDNSSGVSSGYDESASSDTSEGPDITVSRSTTPSLVPSNDDGLSTGARPRIQIDDVDEGNSSDRGFTEVRLEIEGTKIELSGENVADTTIEVEDDSPLPENLPSKVMIVTGDSQNIVVDLSGVPLDLKNAIVSGTALITLPDGLDTVVQPGYTMITIPATNTSRPMSPNKSYGHSQLVVDGVGGSTVGSSPAGHPARNKSSLGKDGVINVAMGQDDNKPLVNKGSSSSGSGSDDECKLFAQKNKAQIWDVIQQTVGKTDTGSSKGKKKITTIFPFHPNQDSYESPDFTIEGHRLDRQRKKVENDKRRRCACRLFGMLFFLVAFLGVLVALSMIYTKGQRYFGSV